MANKPIMYPEKVIVRVPATAANMGPGFDCLGMALDIFNTVTVERSQNFHIAVSGQGDGQLSLGEDNMVYRGIGIAYKEIGMGIPTLSLLCHNDIPLLRGLGSSAAALVGGIVAGNALCGDPLSPERVLQLATTIEGHPDNIASALYGGCQIVVRDGERLIATSLPLPPDLKALLYIPDFPMPTQEARSILPDHVSRSDAIYNVSRAALLANALATGQLEHLKLATQDVLHQPARQTLFPAMRELFEASLNAGALGVFLSGGGSTVLALAKTNEDAILRAMAEAGDRAGLKGTTRMAHPTVEGASVVEKG
ncbi:MAG: homoserine kinase [Dehalococcoidia bacterium]